jgi:hypothetical protein
LPKISPVDNELPNTNDQKNNDHKQEDDEKNNKSGKDGAFTTVIGVIKIVIAATRIVASN